MSGSSFRGAEEDSELVAMAVTELSSVRATVVVLITRSSSSMVQARAVRRGEVRYWNRKSVFTLATRTLPALSLPFMDFELADAREVLRRAIACCKSAGAGGQPKIFRQQQESNLGVQEADRSIDAARPNRGLW